jgi:hypothetical protein
MRVDHNILDEAKGLVHGDRNASYGDPSVDFARTAGMMNSLFSAYLAPGAAFKPEDIAKILICVKLSRTMAKYKRDSAVDIAGYAETMDWVIDEYAKLGWDRIRVRPGRS